VTDVVHHRPPRVLEPVTEEALAAVFIVARTANSFASTPVSDEELRGIWELARWAPTGAKTQPLRVVFVRTDVGDGVRSSWSISATPAKARGSPGFPGSRTPKPSGGNDLPHHPSPNKRHHPTFTKEHAHEHRRHK
jgi:nitroreductase